MRPSNAPEIVKTTDTRIACDGGGGPLGHPKVYLQMGEGGKITCPYCSRQFSLDQTISPNTD